ncbi:hypothetical protein [Massilia sp. DD77]|uniref:hypothetical protein n=1 Tax=Massilia sp. DD77 TaxID=3109349 RepID=UPI003000CEF3
MQDDQSLTGRRRTPAPERMRQGPRSAQPVHAIVAADGADPCAGEGGPLCRDTTYAGIVTAVRSAVERNAGFGA